MQEFTVIMPAYIMNEEHIELTKNAVASFGDIKELIIIDDCSPMGGGYLRSIADIYVRNKKNLGYAASVNRGLRLASTKYVAISNNDIRISPNWKEVAKEVFITDNIYSCHYRMTYYDVPFKYGDKIFYKGRERWCHASFFVINTEKFLFYYDENFFNTYDDYDYFQSVRQAGLRQAYTTKAQFQHKDSSTIHKMENREIHDKDNYEYFKDKWGEYPDVLFAKDFPEQMKKDWRAGFDEL